MGIQLKYYDPFKASHRSTKRKLKKFSDLLKVQDKEYKVSSDGDDIKVDEVEQSSKTWLKIMFLYEMCWRFMEIHIDDAVIIVCFVVIIQHVSLAHVITLILLLLLILMFTSRHDHQAHQGNRQNFSNGISNHGSSHQTRFTIKHIFYLILTLYISILIVLKMLYQLPIVDPDSFSLANNCSVSCSYVFIYSRSSIIRTSII